MYSSCGNYFIKLLFIHWQFIILPQYRKQHWTQFTQFCAIGDNTYYLVQSPPWGQGNPYPTLPYPATSKIKEIWQEIPPITSVALTVATIPPCSNSTFLQQVQCYVHTHFMLRVSVIIPPPTPHPHAFAHNTMTFCHDQLLAPCKYARTKTRANIVWSWQRCRLYQRYFCAKKSQNF